MGQAPRTATPRKRPRAPKGCYWRGNLLWGRAKVAGKEFRWPLRTGDANLAKRLRAQGHQGLIGARYRGEHQHPYESVLKEWAAHIVTQVGPETAKRYGVSLKQLKPDLPDRLAVDQIDKARITAIITRRRMVASIATIRRDLTALSSVLDYAEANDYRTGNPALDALKRLKERRDPIVLPEHAHIERVAKRAPVMLAAMIRVALATGCRQAELTKAVRHHFDAARGQLTVKGKGNKLRVIDLDPGTVAILRKLPARLGCAWLFWHDDGERYSTVANRFRVLVAAELKAAQKVAQREGHQKPDFRRMTFHSMRHRHAVDWLKSGRSIYDLQQRLGHTSIATTEIYLAFLTPEEKRLAKGEVAQKAEHQQRFEVPANTRKPRKQRTSRNGTAARV